ncbi:MAG: dolichol kinase [Leptospiraceae bacterium]|nr:dolichol kinase [Leptospiraceae bacterium]MDW7975559.1 dolichol kinase [Leptospiraceae bacterium]
MKHSFNLKRKLWHLLGLIIPFLLFIDIFRFLEPENPNITRWVGMWLLLAFFIFIFFVELIRMKNPKFNRFFIRFAGALMKESEKKQFHGTVAYIFANFLLFAFFTKEIIFISSLILMISDPIAAYVGIHYGKHKFFKGKTIEGMLAFFISSFLISFLFLMFLSVFEFGNSVFWITQQNFISLFFTILFVSFSCSVVEVFSFTTLNGLIDDNLTIPMTAALTLSLLLFVFGFPLDSFFSPLLFLS